MCSATERRPRAGRERGFGLLLALLVLVVGAATVFVATRTPTPERAARDVDSVRILARARDAVIAYAQFGGTNNKPGALPCPDTDPPSDAGSGRANSHCQGGPDPVYLGRLPWHTIDLAQQFGDRVPEIWYAFDGDFQDDPDEPAELNPETGANLIVDGTSYAAVLILAGDPLETNDERPSAAAEAYLEGENVDGDTEFRDCLDVSECNDRVIGITVDQLFQFVQHRVLAAVDTALQAFFDDHGYLPFAAPFGSPDCALDRPRGQLPLAQGSCAPGDHLDPGDFPAWVVDYGWLETVVYHVADGCTAGTCGAGDLQIDAETGLTAVMAAAGSPLAGQARDSGGSGASDYLESGISSGPYRNRPLSSEHNDLFRGR